MAKAKYLYILEGQTPVPVEDALVWGTWFESHIQERIVKQDNITDEIRVSTVFVSIDQGYSWMSGNPDYEPLLFETLIIGGPEDGYRLRYSTWKGAEHGHDKVVQLVREKLAEEKKK